MLKKVVKVLLFCSLLAAGEVLLFRSTTAHLLATVVKGNTECPFSLTMSSMNEAKAFNATADRMRAGLRLLEQDGDLQLWTTPRGRFWMPKASVAPIPIVLAEEEHEIYGKGPRDVRPGDVVLDCGADIGTFTRRALDHGAGMVVSIEPAPGKDTCLRRNFASEIASGRVIVVHKGVWNREDTLKLYGDSVVEKREGAGVEVPLTTIDNLVAELKLPRVDFVKMDIEGSEKQALAGARATILKFHPRMSIATEHLPDDATAIPQVVRSIAPDYKTECGPCEWSLGKIRPQVIYLF